MLIVKPISNYTNLSIEETIILYMYSTITYNNGIKALLK